MDGEGVHADDVFTAFATTREEKAVGIVAGAWIGGRRGIMLMRTSGLAPLPNVIASLAVPSQLPVLRWSVSAARWASSTLARRWSRAPG